MQGKYLVVDKALVPPLCEKVLEAKQLIEDGLVRDVSEAVKAVGISRSTFYKYKDLVREMSTITMERHAIISMMMSHRIGVLWSVLRLISNYGYNVWTITQNPPVDGKATVVITLELGDDASSLNDMMTELEHIQGLSRTQLLGID